MPETCRKPLWTVSGGFRTIRHWGTTRYTVRKKYALKFSNLYWKLHNSLINYSATNSTNPYITTILLHTTYLLSPIIYYWLLFIKKNKKKWKEKPGCKKKLRPLDHCFGKSLRQFLCEARSILRFPVQVTHFRLTISSLTISGLTISGFNHFRLITSGSSGKTPQYQHTISLFFSF